MLSSMPLAFDTCSIVSHAGAPGALGLLAAGLAVVTASFCLLVGQFMGRRYMFKLFISNIATQSPSQQCAGFKSFVIMFGMTATIFALKMFLCGFGLPSAAV